MNISDLEIFRAVVESGGINRAAERLHRVPSNVTTRIRQLEDDLGVQLFFRHGNRLKISPAGELLLGYSERILELVTEAHEVLQDSTPRGLLRIGTMNSTAAVRLPTPLAAYHKLFPQVKLEVISGSTKSLTAAVISGELEAALVADPIFDVRLAMAQLFQEELVIIAEADHPAISTPADCADRTMLVFSEGCAFRKRLEEWLSDHNAFPDQIIEIASYHAMLGCVIAGMGIALMPLSVLQSLPAHSQISIHKLPHKWNLSVTYLIWRKENKSARIDAMEKILRTTTN